MGHAEIRFLAELEPRSEIGMGREKEWVSFGEASCHDGKASQGVGERTASGEGTIFQEVVRAVASAVVSGNDWNGVSIDFIERFDGAP